MKYLVCITVLALLLPTMSYAEEKFLHNEHDEKKSGIEALSPELRDLLSQEMKALQDGMMSIIPAYSSGAWDEIARTAEKIQKSYILKQQLTESQVKELHELLPHAFIEKDQRFHYLAGMLAHVAKERKVELINFYFSEMNESCVSCHTQFATNRFPALVPKEEKHTH